MTPASLSLWQSTFLDVATKSLVLILVAGAATGLLRKSSAALRHLIWKLLILSLLALPLLSLALPVWRVSLPQSPRTLAPSPAFSQPPPSHISSQPSPTPGPTPSAASPAPSSPTTEPPPVLQTTTVAPPPSPIVQRPADLFRQNWAYGAIVLWLLGVLIVLARTLTALWAIRNLGRVGEPLASERLVARTAEYAQQAGYKRSITLLTAPRRLSLAPMTWGFARPVILLPQEAVQWTEERLQAVLLHELAHIQRGDWLTQVFAQVTCALYWFHPLVWWAAYRLHMESERACDDRVLALGIKPSDYARHLLEVVRTIKSVRPRNVL
ncbi:MAG TPA: M56 family metallopeptidase [Chthonomonadaceae bacterium]|nr:M56 family metallopeptidase [Chthonomonadaceae bacterium]